MSLRRGVNPTFGKKLIESRESRVRLLFYNTTSQNPELALANQRLVRETRDPMTSGGNLIPRGEIVSGRPSRLKTIHMLQGRLVRDTVRY